MGKYWSRLLDVLIPKRRCARGDHSFRIRFRRGYRYETGGRSVASNVTQERRECVHCRYPSAYAEWKTVYSSSIQSLSMPADMMEELERKGELWIEEGWR